MKTAGQKKATKASRGAGKTAAKPEKKRDTTRRHLLDTALRLFQNHGVDGTTMRDIAEAADLSLGAAYYYFPSKEALVFAFYEANQAEIERLEPTGTLREQLGALLHSKLRSIRDQRHMLRTILQRLIDPGDPLSAFSAQTREVRERAIEIFARPLRAAGVAPETARIGALTLWLLQLGMMLVMLDDTSANQKRTHGLIDDTLDMLVPLLPLLSTPMGKAMVDRAVGALDRAGIRVL